MIQIKLRFHVSFDLFLCSRHKMARGHLVFALSVILSFRHSVLPSHQSLSSQLLLHLCMDLNETWYRCCTTSLEVHVGEIIHVRQILAELWSLTLRIFTHFSLSSQLLLHPCMDLNETWQGCCTTSLEVHVGR